MSPSTSGGSPLSCAGSGWFDRRSSWWLWGSIGLWGLVLAVCLVARAEGRLPGPPPGGVLPRGEGTGEPGQGQPTVLQRGAAGATAGAGQYQKIEERSGRIYAEYGCRNFNNDPLRASYSIASRDLASYLQGYGYTQGDLDALNQWQKKALDDAFQYATQNRLKQEDLNRMGAAIKAEYRSKYRSLLVSRGFAILPGNTLAADIPGISRRNVKELRSFAQGLAGTAEQKGYGSSEIIGAALSLVQTAFRYDAVPMQAAGRQTGGVYPPVETLVKGRGDCDTKSALLASLLMNWSKIKLVGVGVPDHYLVAVLRIPAKGEAFVEYQGLSYVLLEPAGPAWLPIGSVGPATSALLNSGTGLAIEPFTAN